MLVVDAESAAAAAATTDEGDCVRLTAGVSVLMVPVVPDPVECCVDPLILAVLLCTVFCDCLVVGLVLLAITAFVTDAAAFAVALLLVLLTGIVPILSPDLDAGSDT